MNNAIPAKKWLIIFLCIALVAVFVIGMTAFLVDPFYQFRYVENRTYFNNTAKFPGPGLVKNYEYDTLIVGSSMTQNFDMELFRQELGVEPLHIGIGGMGLDELLAYIKLSEQTGKCDNYYIGIDQYMLTGSMDFVTAKYLFDDDPVSTFKYLFSYEAWFRYIPMDIALSIISRMPVTVPDKLQMAYNIDYLGNWESDFTFGEEVVIRNYLNSSYGVSSVDTDDIYMRMTIQTDKLFEELPGDKSQYHFFFPPYSVLFWFDAKKDGYMEAYLQIKQYFVEKAQIYGIEVYDFQSADFVFDLDNYKDITHYSGEINDVMVKCFAQGLYLVDSESVKQNNTNIISAIKVFEDKFPLLLSQYSPNFTPNP